MPSISLPLSPLFPRFGAGGLVPSPHGNIQSRLILQDGAQLGKDDFNMDTLSVPFKIFAGSDWKKLLPARGTSISGFPDMIVWDPCYTATLGRAFVEVRMLLKGLTARNGVNNVWNGFLLNPPPRDTTSIASAQISGTDGTSVMDVTFYRPQTVYRYVTTSTLAAPPPTINNAATGSNPQGRRPVVISTSVRGSSAPPEAGDDDPGSGSATYVGYNLGVRQRCADVDDVQVGNFFQNEATVVYEFYDTSAPS